jgi:hypothetical protein
MRIDRLLFFCSLIPIAAYSQVAQSSRYEIPIADAYSKPYAITNLGDHGLLVYGTVIADGIESIEVIRLDTALSEVWRGYIKLDRRSVILMAQSIEGRAMLLLKDRFTKSADFTLLVIYIDQGNYLVHNIVTQIPFSPTHFLVTNTSALIGGYFNYRPLVLHFGFETQKSRILPGFFNEPGELNQLTANKDGTVDVVVCAKSYDRRKSLWIRNYDAAGELVKSVVMSPGNDRHLIFGRVVRTEAGEQMVCGVYGRHVEYSRGLFLASIDEFGEYNIRYYNYSDLHRFFNYMKAKREKRIQERIERKRVKGKKMKLNYRIMVTEVLPHGDQFIMLGEAFYPHYSYAGAGSGTGRMLYSARSYGTPLTRGDLVFDGYQYTHAVVVGFDKAGKLVWDNSFEINDVRTFQLQQFVKIAPDDDRVALLYLFDNVIRSKIIKEKDIIEGKAFDQLKMNFSDDVVRAKDTESSSLEYWYGTTFYATGFQVVRQVQDQGTGPARRVFFINKIEYK